MITAAGVLSLSVQHKMKESNVVMSLAPTQPLLSVLVPAFNYVQGVLQIVVPLLREQRSDLEIIVHDDSSDSQVEHAMRDLLLTYGGLQYVRNNPAKGPIDNWNGLLASAKGRYAIVIHHDDFPLSETFASDILADLSNRNWPDILVLTCITHDLLRNRLRFGVWQWFKRLIVLRWPVFLLRRNVVGPPAAIVIRRECIESFDCQLKWLVDVEYYFRLFKNKFNRIEFSNLIMISSSGLPGAITTGIHGSRNNISRSEINYIVNKFAPNSSLHVLLGRTTLTRLFLNIEFVSWIVVKSMCITYHFLFGWTISLTDVRRRQKLFEGSV